MAFIPTYCSETIKLLLINIASQRPFSLGEVDICQVEEEGRLRKRGVGQCRVSKRCDRAVGQIFLEFAQDLGF